MKYIVQKKITKWVDVSEHNTEHQSFNEADRIEDKSGGFITCRCVMREDDPPISNNNIGEYSKILNYLAKKNNHKSAPKWFKELWEEAEATAASNKKHREFAELSREEHIDMVRRGEL